jgi:hypothetical protein
MNTPEDDAHAQAALEQMSAAGIPVTGWEFKQLGYYFRFTRKLTSDEWSAANIIAWRNINPAIPG